MVRVAAYDESGGQALQDVTITVAGSGPEPGPGSPSPTAVATPASVCTGDCNRDGRVDVNELVLGTNIALTLAPASACAEIDCRATGTATIDCLTRAVRAALEGCP